MFASLLVQTVRSAQRCTQGTTYSPGWEDMGVVVKLAWMVVVGLADDVGLPLAENLIPDGGKTKCISRSIILCKLLQMFVSSLVSNTVRSTQEMYTRDSVLTGLGGHGCGCRT